MQGLHFYHTHATRELLLGQMKSHQVYNRLSARKYEKEDSFLNLLFVEQHVNILLTQHSGDSRDVNEVYECTLFSWHAVASFRCHVFTLQAEVTKFGINKENMFEFWDVRYMETRNSQAS